MINRIYIEITNACNLSCSFCPSPTKRLRQMTIDQFKKIINEIKGHTQHIYFHVQGEPLSHPLLNSFLDIAYENQLKVHIVTNGTMLSKINKTFFIHPALAQCSISLHAWEEFTEEDFLAHLNHLIQLKEIILQSKASIFLRIWNKKSERMHQIMTHFLPEMDIEKLNKLGKHRIKLNQNITIDLDDQFKWPSLDDPFVSSNGRCHAGTKMLAILVDGTVTPCCLDPQAILDIGNIYEQSFDELIKNQRYINLINGFKQNKLIEDLCQHCSYRTRFK